MGLPCPNPFGGIPAQPLWEGRGPNPRSSAQSWGSHPMGAQWVSTAQTHGAHRRVDINKEPISHADHPVVLQQSSAAQGGDLSGRHRPPAKETPTPGTEPRHRRGVAARSPAQHLPCADGEALAVPTGPQHHAPTACIALQQPLGLGARHVEEAAGQAGGEPGSHRGAACHCQHPQPT